MELVIYIHGKGGSAEEAEHYRALFPEAEVLGFDYQSQTPWEAEAEFQAYYEASIGSTRMSRWPFWISGSGNIENNGTAIKAPPAG
ncbi:MAG: hypothetical protein IKO94_03160 [Selenomonadaceae bacterium]|nr:hypothetical protein [Selenomonadaceae bacterium]